MTKRKEKAHMGKTMRAKKERDYLKKLTLNQITFMPTTIWFDSVSDAAWPIA